MLAIHGFWSPIKGLCVWAEDSDRRVKSPSQAVQSARPHPFAAPAELLAEIVAGKPASAMLALPSVLSAPLDSPELVRIRPRRAPEKTPALMPWSVPVVTFDATSALAFLHRLSEDAIGHEHDVRYGQSVAHLAQVGEFAVDLARRGRVLPEIDEDENGYYSRWRPVLQGSDVVATQQLIASMPPVGRAETHLPIDVTGQAPANLIDIAVNAFVDAAVRDLLTSRAVRADELLPRRRGRRPTQAPVAELWVESLLSGDGRFAADHGEIADLEEALSRWNDVGLGDTGPARATFRLSEAIGDDDENSEWQLEFLLQSIEDPSLMVPASQVWSGGDGLGRWLSRPDELMLAELGRAATIYPDLGDALRQARPTALTLDADGAYDFLAIRSALLDQAGFGVLVPSWWSKRGKLGLTAKASIGQDGVVTGGMFSQESLVQFEWRLAIGDQELTDDELEVLAATKVPLVRLRGEWVAVDPEQVRRGLEFLRSHPREERTAGEVIALAASHPDDADAPLPVVSVDADGWLGDLLSGAVDKTLESVTLPPHFNATLRPYQERGLSWLAFLAQLGLGACLADDMGLGKTIQLLALETHRRAGDRDTGPTLLLCPMSLVGNWQREAAKFAPYLRFYAHHGSGRLRGDDLTARLADTDVVVTTYQTAVRDIDELESRTWERVVLDEAQAIKNSLSRSAKAVRRLTAGHRVALTGTPMENRLAELWSVMDFLNPGMLGSPELFRTRYAIPVERYGYTEPAEQLRTVTRPYILRRLKTDKNIIDDLPEKIEVKQHCYLTTEQASLYQSVVDEMLQKIEHSDGIERRGNVLATMTKLKQICNHPAQLLHDRSAVGRRSGKVARLEEILDEIVAEGDQALLFTQFTEFAEMLLPHLAARYNRDVLYLHGGTPKPRRDEMVERFQAGGTPLFLLSLKAGGTGLNLTAANHVVHLDRWWNPAVENQATDRAFRIGQKRTVQVRKFVCVGTLEEKIDQVIEDKKALTDLVIRDGEQWLTELSTGELRDLFALSEEAIGE